MKKSNIYRTSLIFGIVLSLISVIILIYAEGPRRWYSGLFLLFLGVLAIVNYFRKYRSKEKP